MKGLLIGAGAAALLAAAAAGYFGTAGGGKLTAKAAPPKVSGPVQGSSFDAPAVKAAPAMTALAPPTAVAAEASTPAEPAAAPEPAQIAAVAPPAAVAVAAPDAAPQAAGVYDPLRFDLLASYKYEEPKPALGAKPGAAAPTPIPNQIPKNVVALDGRQVEIEGYMVPMEVTDEGNVKTFILTKNQPQCCFGDVEAPNDWIDVKMQPDQTTEFMLDRPVKVQGKLEVGEKLEDGFLVSLYRMTADKVRD